MARYDRERHNFSKRAHRAAWPVYKKWLPESALIIDLERSKRDVYRDEDYAVRVYLEKAGHHVEMSVQEKFRRMEHADYRDLTIAYYDGDRDGPLHLEDTWADYIVYGYYDDKADAVGEVIVVNMGEVKRLLSAGLVEYETREHGDKELEFLCIPFSEIEDTSAEVYHYNKPDIPA